MYIMSQSLFSYSRIDTLLLSAPTQTMFLSKYQQLKLEEGFLPRLIEESTHQIKDCSIGSFAVNWNALAVKASFAYVSTHVCFERFQARYWRSRAEESDVDKLSIISLKWVLGRAEITLAAEYPHMIFEFSRGMIWPRTVGSSEDWGSCHLWWLLFDQ